MPALGAEKKSSAALGVLESWWLASRGRRETLVGGFSPHEEDGKLLERSRTFSCPEMRSELRAL